MQSGILARAFNIRQGERTLVFVLMLYSAAIGIAINYFFTAASALFLTRFEIETLPYTILASGVALYAVRAVVRFAEAHLSATNLLIATLVFLLILLSGLRLGLSATDSDKLTFSLLVVFRVLILLLIIGFWGLANRLFTLGQSKRLFPIISAGDVISVMIGSFLVPVIISFIGTANLLWVVVGSIAVCLGCVLFIRGHAAEKLTPSEAPIRQQDNDTPRENLFRNQYIVLIFGLYVLAWVINYALDYAFLGQLQARYVGDPERIAGFIGVLFGLIQLTNVFLKFFIAGRLLSRYGVRFGLLVSPIIITIAILVSVAAGVLVGVGAVFFWLVSVTKYSEEVLREAFNESSTRILYQPLPAQQRTAALGFVEGNGFPLTAIIAGGILVIFSITGTYTPLRIAALLGVLGLAWIAVAVATHSGYIGALTRALQRRSFRAEGQGLTGDAVALEMLLARLDSPRSDEVVYALELLRELAPEQSGVYLADLLSHPAADVRRYVLSQIESSAAGVAPEVVLACARNDDDPKTRAAALRAYCALGPRTMLADLEPFLQAEDNATRRAALVGLLRHGDQVEVRLATAQLDALARQSQPEARILAAETMGSLGDARYAAPLLALIADDHKAVQHAALTAAGKVDHPTLWPTVIDKVGEQSLTEAALDAIQYGGTSALPAIAEQFATQPSPSRGVLMNLARVCGRIREPEAAVLLVEYLDWPQRDVRGVILASLAGIGYQAKVSATIAERIRAEARDALYCLTVRENADMLLQDAGRDELAAIQLRILYLLALIHNAETLAQARHALQFGNESEQSYAVEMIEILIGREMRPVLLPLIEEGLDDATRAERLASALGVTMPSQEEAARAIVEEPGHIPWYRAVVLHTHRHPTIENLPEQQDVEKMLSTIEKVLVLKTVNLFENIPDHVLATIAEIVAELEYPAGQTIIHKGEVGDSMYVIVSGKVRAHDGNVVFNYLEERDVFGELAVLDTEPRTASITAEVNTTVFRLQQADFYTVMADYPQVSQSVIRVILGYLRARVRDVSELSARVAQLEQKS